LRYESRTGLDHAQIRELVARIHQVLPAGRRGARLRWRVVLTLVLPRSNVPRTLLADLAGISQATDLPDDAPLLEQIACLHRRSLPKHYAGRWCWSTPPWSRSGTDASTVTPTNPNYSDNATKPGVNIQLLSDLDGQSLAASDPAPGRTHGRAGSTSAGNDQLLATGHRGRLTELRGQRRAGSPQRPHWSDSSWWPKCGARRARPAVQHDRGDRRRHGRLPRPSPWTATQAKPSTTKRRRHLNRARAPDCRCSLISCLHGTQRESAARFGGPLQGEGRHLAG
jgi:hypothetical protein